MDLSDTVALVTGAGKRLGRAIALELAAAGASVVVHYGRSREAARRTADDIRALGRDGVALSADLTEPDDIEALFDAVEDRFGRLDVLVNSAASFERKPIDEITAADWDAVQAVNVRAPFLCTQRAARLMRATNRAGLPGAERVPGSVINLADMAGVTTWKEFAHHGVSKAALLHLTMVSARELGPEVRVNAIIPGPVLPAPGEDATSESWIAKGARVPLGRPGDVREVATAAVFLTRNDYVTGTTLFVDGGEHLLAGGGLLAR